MLVKNKWLRIILGEFLLMLLLIGGLTLVKVIPSQKTIENNYREPTFFRKIFEKDLTTTFKAEDKNLKRVDVLFKNPNLESRDEIEIILFGDKQEIFRKKYNGYNFGDTSHARIDFSKIRDSKGKEFTLIVKETKLVDGKLEVGIKNNEISCIQYYGEKISLLEGFRASLDEVKNIILNEKIVLVLPMLLWGIFLW
jgi:hypothetical protein